MGMSTGGNEMRVLDDPEVLRLIADPLRLRILELLRQAPHTVTELADLLGVARTRLYYHVRLLESHDLVAVAETHVVAGITEKRYRVTAFRLSVDKALFGSSDGDQAPLDVYLSVVLDEVATEIRRAVAAGLIDFDSSGQDAIQPRRMMVGRNWYRFTDEELARFAALYEDFWKTLADRQVELPGGAQSDEGLLAYLADDVSRDDPDQPRRLYEWLVGFYPVVPPDADGKDPK